MMNINDIKKGLSNVAKDANKKEIEKLQNQIDNLNNRLSAVEEKLNK